MALNIKWVGAHPNNYRKGRAGYSPDRIVMHWIVGSLASADATFNNPTRYASSTYGVGGTKIHQYVRETNAPYTNGDWEANMRSITIEHEGSPQKPPTRLTHETSAKLVADICERYGWTVDYALRKPRHSQYSPTQCPGTLDISLVKKLAKDIMKPEWEKNNKSVKKEKYVATGRINLISFETGKVIKSYPKGTQFDIASETTYRSKKYYRTQYSTSKGVWNGLIASSLQAVSTIPKPQPEPEPQPPENPDTDPEPIDNDIVGRVTRLEATIGALLDMIRSIWNIIGVMLNKVRSIGK